MKAILLMLLLTLPLAACNTSDVADDAAAANALLEFRATYADLKRQLEARVDELPTETGLALLDLEEAADRYVDRLSVAWRDGVTLDELDALYREGAALYHQGEALIAPVRQQLPPDTRAALARFRDQARRIDALYRKLRHGDPARQEMIRAGLELATLALRIGLAAL